MLYIDIVLCSLFLFALCKKNKRLYALDLVETLPLRGMLAISVFLCHACVYIENNVDFFRDFGNWGPFSVATFFFLSGYGLAYSFKKKGKEYLNGFFLKRLKKLLLPLVIVALIWNLPKIVMGDSIAFLSVLANPCPKSWFVYALAINYVAYYFCFRHTSASKMALILMFAFTAVYMFCCLMINKNSLYATTYPIPIGMAFALYEEKIRKYINVNSGKFLWAVFITFLLTASYSLIGKYHGGLLGWGILPDLTIYLFIIVLALYLGGLKSKVINYIGSISYEFYIVHGAIVIWCGHFYNTSFKTMESIVWLIVTFGVVLITSSMLHFVVKKIKL